MEFGPRALGNRSILADPRSEIMQKNLNLKLSTGRALDPFCTSILEEKVSEWFDYTDQSPYMLMVANVKKNKQISMTNEEKNYLELIN